MTIGGYTMLDNGIYGIKVKHYEAVRTVFLQGDDAQVFRDAWKIAQEYGSNFAEFLNDHEYDTLFQ